METPNKSFNSFMVNTAINARGRNNKAGFSLLLWQWKVNRYPLPGERWEG